MNYHGVKEVISSANIGLLYAPRIVVNLVTAAMGSADLFLLSWGFSIYKLTYSAFGELKLTV